MADLSFTRHFGLFIGAAFCHLFQLSALDVSKVCEGAIFCDTIVFGHVDTLILLVWSLTSISYLHDFFVYFFMHFILQFSLINYSIIGGFCSSCWIA